MALTKRQLEFMARVRPILIDLEARCLWQAKGPNGSLLDAQVIGGSVVIFHYYAEGGVQHYVPGSNGFDGMGTQLHQLAAAVA